MGLGVSGLGLYIFSVSQGFGLGFRTLCPRFFRTLKSPKAGPMG